MRKILFFAEAVTLAHVARPVALAARLGAGWEVEFAVAPEFEVCFDGTRYRRHAIPSIASAVFGERLAAGKPLYRRDELEGYVASDLAIIEAVKPDVVVGDFRLSLSVSARLARVPYAAICNAHWSPYAAIGPYPLPEIGLERFIGETLGTPLFRLALPLALRLHAAPLNAVRRERGMAPLHDLRDVYVDGDVTLYADTPGLVPTAGAPASHHYIGPVLWAPAMPMPDWERELPETRCAYVTLGSSGRASVLPDVLDALEAAGWVSIVATAGRADVEPVPGKRFVARFMPGDRAAACSDLVICNGGSATAYQALAAGKPVLGLASNMDQFLTMQCVERMGAGRRLRAVRVSRADIGNVITSLESSSRAREAAKVVAAEFAVFQRSGAFERALGVLL